MTNELSPGVTINELQELIDPNADGDQRWLAAALRAILAPDDDENHLSPGAMLQLATTRTTLSMDQLHHLHSCRKCRVEFSLYRMTDKRKNPSPVPQFIRDQVYTDSFPSLFPDGTVALASWQVGRLELLAENNPPAFEAVISHLAAELERFLLLDVLRDPERTVVLAPFGSVVTVAAREAAASLSHLGFTRIRIASVHDLDKPKFVCPRQDLIEADIVCLCDVARSGKLLDRIGNFAKKESKACRIYKLAFIKQNPSISEDSDPPEFDCVWTESLNPHISYKEFVRSFPERQHDLRLFEPELGRADVLAILRMTGQRFQSLVDANALRVNSMVEGQRYLYRIDPEEFLEIPAGQLSPRQKKQGFPGRLFSDLPAEYLEHKALCSVNGQTRRAVKILLEMIDRSGRTCFIFHKRRDQKAGKIARHLRDALRLTGVSISLISIGWKLGSFFDITDDQASAIKSFDQIIIIDAAMRTGSTLLSLCRALRERMEDDSAKISGFVVAASSQSVSLRSADSAVAVEVRSLISTPLLPPAEDLRIGMKSWSRTVSRCVSSISFRGSLSRLKRHLPKKMRRQVSIPDLKSKWLATCVSSPCIRAFMREVLTCREIAFTDRVGAVKALVVLNDFSWIGELDWVTANLDILRSWRDSKCWRVFVIAILGLNLQRREGNCSVERKKELQQCLEMCRGHLQRTLREDMFQHERRRLESRYYAIGMLSDLVDSLLAN